MKKYSRIFIVEKNNISEISLIHYCQSHSFTNILRASACNLDVMEQHAVRTFFEKEKPEYVFLTHITSGGIAANIKNPALMYINLQVQNNIIHSSYEFGVRKLLFFGSSCAYPRNCPQPIKEDYLLSGLLKETNESYAIVKIAGMKMCQSYNKQYGVNYITAISVTIYGSYDHFDLERSHVMSSLIRKFHETKLDNQEKIVVWGTGKPRREFIYIDDLIEASIFLMDYDDAPEVISDVSIYELAQLIKEIVGFQGEIVFDTSKPDGTLQKLLDSSKIAQLGWTTKTSVREGIARTYQWYKKLQELSINKNKKIPAYTQFL